MNIDLALDAYWMPFMPNRDFKKNPMLFVGAKGTELFAADGQIVLDAASGLWCCNAGHRHPKIVEAMKRQIDTLDFLSPIGLSYPNAFELADRLLGILPEEFNKIFFTNSGSEAVDTALKIALLYHQRRDQPRRKRFVGRDSAYHGRSFGGMAVGGYQNHKGLYGDLLLDVDHMAHLGNLRRQCFVRGASPEGEEFANELEDIISKRGAESIAAVIVEPVSGSAGVYIPPLGYLKRLREITKKHGILLIFDEVITAFGRLGSSSAAAYFNVAPDIMLMAKAITNGAVPMGAVAVKDKIYNTIAEIPGSGIEFDHGYTTSAHPLAVAACSATLDVYKEEGLFERAAEIAPIFEDAVHSLKGVPGVVDIRNIGLMAAIEVRSASHPAIAHKIHREILNKGVYVRSDDHCLKIAPPLTISTDEIHRIFEVVEHAIRAVE